MSKKLQKGSQYEQFDLGIVATFMGTTAFTRSKENGK